MADYLPLNLVEAEAEHYGVKVGRLGEDLDMGTFAFTHDRRRAIAAALALYRFEGERVWSVSVGTPHWWRVVDNCGCGEACTCEPDEDGETYHERCEHSGLPPCQPERHSWMGLPCKADDLGALPVLVLEVSI